MKTNLKQKSLCIRHPVLQLLTVLSILFSVFVSSGQKKKIDSLRNILPSLESNDTLYIDAVNLIADNFNFQNIDSVAHYAHRAIHQSKKIQYSKGLADGYKNLGYAYIPWSRYDTAKAYFDSSLQIANKHRLYFIASEANKGLGVVYEESGRYQECIKEYFKALELKNKIDDQLGIGKIHNNLGQAYHNMGAYDSATSHLMKALSNQAFVKKYNQGGTAYLILGMVKFSIGEMEEARKNFKKALSVFDLPDHVIRIATLNGWMGMLSFTGNDLDSALYYFQLSLDQFQSIKHLKGVSGLTSRVADTYRAQGRYDLAIDYYHRSIRLKREIEDIQYQSEILLNLARCYKEMGDMKNALEVTKESISIAESIISKREALEAYAFLHQLYAEMNRYADAYKAMQKHLLYRDSVLTEEKINEIKRLETVYEVSRLEQEKQQLIQEQEREELLLQSEIKRGEIIQYASLAVIALFLLLFINAYVSYTRKKKDNAVISQQNSQISRAAKQLADSNKQLSRLSNFKEGLTHMIAHDMKNSLNTILGLSSGNPKDEKMHSIGQSGQMMLNLVTNMLDVQKFEETEVSLNKKTHNLKGLVEEARKQTALLLQMKSLRLNINVPEKLSLEVDAEIIVRILVNLLSNAIKYSRVGANVTISAKTLDDNGHYSCSIGISDEGDGIDPQKLPHIFDKFWQSDAKSSGQAASTGLGLTFCKIAIEAHDGNIGVESEKGRGTTFYITLPMKEEVITSAGQSNHLDEECTIMEDEKALIARYASELRKLKVYQVGAIKTILEKLEEGNINSPWKNDIKAAVLHGDEKKFDLLLEMAN